MGFLKKLIHRHTWKPLKTMYRYRANDGIPGSPKVTVKKCQCQGCGKIAYIRFVGKDVYCKDWRMME